MAVAAPPKPTIAFVPGAWHQSLVFQPVISLLESAGYSCATVELPSVGGSVASMAEDTDAIYEFLERLVLAGKEVVLVMHSYGGIPGAGAVKGLGKVAGRAGGVTHLVFLASFILEEGATVLGLLNNALPPWVGREGDTLICLTPEKTWYQDLPADEASKWVALLKPQSAPTFLTPVAYAGWKHIPSTYLMTENDQAVPVQVQEAMLAAAGCIRSERCSSGHAPFLSQPDVVARLVRKCAGEKSG